MRKRIPLFLLLILLVTSSFVKTFAQQLTDTIYFDDSWAISEKPLANYYRTCMLNKVDEIFYKGPVRDYYLNGQLEMTGQYDLEGKKKGTFTFYNEYGIKTREGNYNGDKMKGLWSFYDRNGILNAQFDCVSSKDFTPVLLINSKGDTIVKNGNGKFTFNSIKDLPGIFPRSKNYYVSGEVVNSKREGVITYALDVQNAQSNFQEYYTNGKFVKAVDVNTVFNQKDESSSPYGFLDLEPEKVQHIDNFEASKFVFGSGLDNGEQLVRFLLQNEKPHIVSQANSYSENTIDIFNIAAMAIRKSIAKTYMQNVSFANPPDAIKSRLLSFDTPADTTAPTLIEATAEVIIDTAGLVRQCIFKGNLDVAARQLVFTYLGRLINLVPYEVDGVKKPSKLIIHLFTMVKSLENAAGKKMVNYNYFASIEDDEKPVGSSQTHISGN